MMMKAGEVTNPLGFQDAIDAGIGDEGLIGFGEARPITGDIQLVIGSVGVDKSLLDLRNKEFLQPEPLREKNHWASLNFNNVPENSTNWNKWVCEAFSRSVIEEGAPIQMRDTEDPRAHLRQRSYG